MKTGNTLHSYEFIIKTSVQFEYSDYLFLCVCVNSSLVQYSGHVDWGYIVHILFVKAGIHKTFDPEEFIH